MRRGLFIALVGTVGLLCGCDSSMNENSITSNANTTNANAVVQATPARGVVPKHDDTDFVGKVAMDGMAEVDLGRLAVQKAKNPEVKSFAQRMVADHSKASTELTQLASNKGISLPSAVNEDQRADHDKLAKLSGAEFDNEYMSIMSAAHDKAVSAFEDESENGSDADIKAWAAKILPTLKEHQTMAKDIAAKLK